MQSLQTLQPLQTFELCKHSLLTDSILPIMDLMSEGTKTAVGQEFTCHICNTDSYIEVRVAEDSSTMTIVMTRWFNLGPGLTQDDDLWRTHIQMIPFGQAKVPHDNLYTNPRFYFEGIMASKSFKELESRNLSYLKDNKYKTFMFPRHITGIGWPEVWHTVFEKPPESKDRPKMRELKWLSFLLRSLKKARR
ncbi:hypothetical protein N7454_000086 [Penicillium verhagenii]|nr:hypothetical protein N7454_000086 [Penicillium verhagenii]